MTSLARRGRDATWLVAVAAALWGLDGLLRKPLALDLTASTIVFWEHVIALAVLLPWVPAAVRAFVRCSWRDRLAMVVIGVGASAVATVLFTQSIKLASASGDFVAPFVLQKLQPVIAIALAVVVLRERLRPGFAAFLLPALAGAWLLTFTDPLDVSVTELEPALYAIGAAALWAGGTVLGRMVSESLGPRDITTLRFGFGLVGSTVCVWVTGSPFTAGWGNAGWLVLLALIPSLLALELYYRALQTTPASRATLAELAFPATAAIVGVAFLGTHLSATQWFGLAIVALAVTALGWHETRREPCVEPDPELVGSSS